MKIQLPKDIECKKVAWTIEDFSKLKANEPHSSQVFAINNTSWQFLIRVREKEDLNDLSVFLQVADVASLAEGWSVYAEFSLVVLSQVSRELSMKKELKHKFYAKDVNWGFKSFMPLSKLHNPNNGYVLNDKCKVEVEFFVIRSEKISIAPTSHLATPNGEFVDFMDLGHIEKAFIPLLNEVCSWHPSLVQCQKKRTHKFTEWAFTALGRVLHFLKTKKAKDMTEQDCEQLQQLWKELETFRFDLAWLEPHVKFALGVKAYKEKVENVKKLREDLKVSEAEMKRLREKLANTKESVEKVRNDLVKKEEGFVERDMDAEIGYGKL